LREGRVKKEEGISIKEIPSHKNIGTMSKQEKP
jgi:hypothetical protein